MYSVRSPSLSGELHVKPDRRNRVRLGLNCLLIQTPEANILVDTGAGSKRPEKFKELFGLNGNKLLKGLRSLGLTARDINLVILTHLHFDHGGDARGWTERATQSPLSPRRATWSNGRAGSRLIAPTNATSRRFSGTTSLPLEEKGMLTLLDGDSQVIPGVSVRVANGPSRAIRLFWSNAEARESPSPVT